MKSKKSFNEEQITCKNCTHVFTGNFCNNCGEKVYSSHDKSLIHIGEEFFHFLTHFEGAFLTTLKTVITKPGKFSLDYCNGIRKKYFKPVSLFLLLVILYLLFPKFQGLNMKLETYAAKEYGFTWLSHPLINNKIEKENISYNALAQRYNAKSPTISKATLFSLIPLAALVLAILYFFKRRPLFDHFIISIELSAFFIALHYLIIPFVAFITTSIHKPWERFSWDGNAWLTYTEIALDILFISLAHKRFYGTKWVVTIPAALIYLYVFGEWIYYTYRLLVLYLTIQLC
jgi:hypothetical protein